MSSPNHAYLKNTGALAVDTYQPRPNRRQMVKILKYDNPDHKIKLKIRQFQFKTLTTSSNKQAKQGRPRALTPFKGYI